MKSSRRAFLGQLALVAAPATLKGAALPQHTLVCVFLRGGADTLNLYVPYADDAYHRARPTLALYEKNLIRLDDRYGLHPALAPFESIYKEGRLGLVQSVGTDNTSGSHFECQDQMEHGDSMTTRPAGGGWLGRFLRERTGGGSSALSAVAIGTKLPESLRGAPAVSVLEKVEDSTIGAMGEDASAAVNGLEAMYGGEASLLGARGLQTLDLFKRVSALQMDGAAPANGARYPRHVFGDGLREIARLIRGWVGLEVACVDLEGWDTHFFQGGATGSQATRAQILAEGIAAFETDLRELRSAYTILVMTEFGRRVYENASLGTDHGRGFTLAAIGDRVKGGRVLGPWPVAAMDESNPLGPGGLAIAHDYRSVFAEVLNGATGLDGAALQRVFPGADLQPVGLF